MAIGDVADRSGRGGAMSYANPTRGRTETGALLGLATLVGFSTWVLFLSPLISVLGSFVPNSESLLGTFLLTALRFVPLWLIAWYTPRLFGRSSKTLIRPDGTWQRHWIWFGFSSWFALSALLSLAEWLLLPESFSLTLSWQNVALSLLVAIVVFPIQTSAEELVFRGLLPQSLGQWLRHPALLAVASGLLFAIPHLLNPEALGEPWLALLAYGSLGAVWSAAVLRTGGLEVALGAHLANNIFALSIVGYEESALPSIAIWTTPPVDLSVEVIKGLIGGGLWLLALYWWSRKREQ